MLPVKVVQTEFKSVWGFEAEPEGKKHLSFFFFQKIFPCFSPEARQVPAHYSKGGKTENPNLFN